MTTFYRFPNDKSKSIKTRDVKTKISKQQPYNLWCGMKETKTVGSNKPLAIGSCASSLQLTRFVEGNGGEGIQSLRQVGCIHNQAFTALDIWNTWEWKATSSKPWLMNVSTTPKKISGNRVVMRDWKWLRNVRYFVAYCFAIPCESYQTPDQTGDLR